MSSDFFRRPLVLDNFLTLPVRVMPSPMVGVMSPLFCRAVRELDLVPFWITPFVGTGANSVPSRRVFRRTAAPFQGRIPPVVQLLGHSPEALCGAINVLHQAGFHAVNLNFACPSSTVLSAGNGGACLRDPVQLHELCRAAAEAAKGKMNLSLKLRTGWDSPADTARIAEAVSGTGISWIICHFRTVREEYRPVPQPEAIARLCRFTAAVSPVPVIGNGDILTADDAQRMVEYTHCAGVAVARGLLHDPFLLKRIQGDVVSAGDRLSFLRKCCVLAQADHLPDKWYRNEFRQFARLTFGVDSPEFRHYLPLTPDDIRQELLG